MNSIRSNNLILKYQRFIQSGYKDRDKKIWACDENSIPLSESSQY